MRYFVSGMAEMPDLEKWFPKILVLVTKIERWWFREVEMPILSDSDGRIQDIHGTAHDFDDDEPFSNSVIAIRILCQVGLGNHDEAWALHHIFSRQGRD